MADAQKKAGSRERQQYNELKAAGLIAGNSTSVTVIMKLDHQSGTATIDIADTAVFHELLKRAKKAAEESEHVLEESREKLERARRRLRED